MSSKNAYGRVSDWELKEAALKLPPADKVRHDHYRVAIMEPISCVSWRFDGPIDTMCSMRTVTFIKQSTRVFNLETLKWDYKFFWYPEGYEVS